MKNPARLVRMLLVGGLLSAIGTTPLFAQPFYASGTLADLVANGGSLTIGDKTFSGFSYRAIGLTSFDPSQIVVNATEIGGVDYLAWSGNMSLVSDDMAIADLLLNYKVTANHGLISMIDQAYTGSVQNGFLAVDETVHTGAPGGDIVAWSHLDAGDLSDQPTDSIEGDSLIINPPQSVLFVTKDIGMAVFGGSVNILRVEQSFHQVPEPSALALGTLGGAFLLFRSRREKKRN